MVRIHFTMSSMFGPSRQPASMMLAAFCSYLVALSFGYVIGYSSPAIPDLIKKQMIGSQGASIFGALMTVGGVVGCPLAGWTLEKFGRKGTLLFTSLPFLFGWILITLAGARSPNFLYIGRFLGGIGSGMSTVVMGVYVAETAPKELRGMLCSGVQLGIVIGIVVVYILGMFCSWRMLAVVGYILPISAILLSLKIPETPRFYLLNGRKAEAVRSLQLLRGTMDVEEELKDIEDGLPDKGEVFTWRDILKPEVSRPLKVTLTLMVFQQLTGINVIMFYTVSIFESAGYKENSIGATIAVGLVQVVATAVSVYLMDRAGRRPLIFIAGAIMAGSCFTMGLYYHWAAAGAASNLSWMALASLIFYIIGFSIGWGPIPGLIMAEVFPVKARGAASAISCISNWGTAFIVTSTFLDAVKIYGEASAYWFFCLATALGTFLVYLFVPETKGKSLEEIELYFLGRIIHGV